MTQETSETATWTSLEGIAAAAQTVDDVIKAGLGPVFAQARRLHLGRRSLLAAEKHCRDGNDSQSTASA